MNILGISAFYHSSSVSILKNGKIFSAAEEERFTRIKHDKNFPFNALEFCLRSANLDIQDIDLVAYYEKPSIKFTRLLASYIANFPKGYSSYNKVFPEWLSKNLNFKSKLRNYLNYSKDIFFCPHHISHMSSAYYPSPFLSSAIVSMDGVGEWTTLGVGQGKDNKISMLKKINFPHSLGLFYSAFTHYCGFKVNSGEYKLMGLAPYGEPTFLNKILNNMIDIKDDGSFLLNMKYFDYDLNENMINNFFEQLFQNPRRKSESELTKFYMDIASSVQKVLEIILIKIVNFTYKITKEKNLCLAGGVALNCVANSKILNNSGFENIWIQPASGDSGGSLGCALNAWHHLKDNKKNILSTSALDYQAGSLLGSFYNNQEIKKFLEKNKIKYKFFENDLLSKKIAMYLSRNKVVGRFFGKMEFGPRALGNRSILANPLTNDIQEKLNIKIKFRENFRPFAPAVMYDKFNYFFELHSNDKNEKSPYMLFTAHVKGHKEAPNSDNWREKLKNNISPLPGITHVDGSARVQTVHPEINTEFYNLIRDFYEITDCPVLINTSFNIRGEPIVESPSDAYNCFINTGIDILMLGNFIITKDHTNDKIDKKYIESFELD